jgi:hypothetical protein
MELLGADTAGRKTRNKKKQKILNQSDEFRKQVTTKQKQKGGARSRQESNYIFPQK